MDEARIEVAVFGEQAVFTMLRDGSTVLEAARGAGVLLPSSCEAGSCATCRARLVSGRVTLLNNFALDDAELAAGFVLACQAVPLSAQVVLDFDVEP
jgi:ring-1,2-phenylacetyl-CoA epoxidase subunit PaaE